MTLQDADSTSWRSPKRPDFTPDQLKLLGLAKLYAAADSAVQAEIGVTTLAEYRRLTEARSQAIEALFQAARGMGR